MRCRQKARLGTAFTLFLDTQRGSRLRRKCCFDRRRSRCYVLHTEVLTPLPLGLYTIVFTPVKSHPHPIPPCHPNPVTPATCACQNTVAGKRQILAEISFLRFLASSSSSDNGSGISHIVAVKEMLTDTATPMILMKKESRTLRSIQEDFSDTIPTQVVK